MSSSTLSNTVSIVTGSGRGIGRAIAIALAEAGSAVAVLARSRSEIDETVALIENAGGRAAAWTVDVTNREEVDSVVSTIEAKLGPITLLVNNAGMSKGSGPLWEADPDEWWQTVEINLRGPYHFCRAVVPRMVKRKSGRIVNVATHLAMGPAPLATAYSCSKAGLMHLSDSLAASVKDHGIQVFAISPGFVWTAMTRRVVDEMERLDPGFDGIPDEASFPPELAAKLVERLASGEADALTGRYFHVKDDFDAILKDAKRIESDDLLALRFTEWQTTE